MLMDESWVDESLNPNSILKSILQHRVCLLCTAPHFSLCWWLPLVLLLVGVE